MTPHTRERIHGYISDSLPEEELFVLLEEVERDPETAQDLADAMDLQGKLQAARFVRSGESARLGDQILRIATAPKFSARVIHILQRNRRGRNFQIVLALTASLAIAFLGWRQFTLPPEAGHIVLAGVGIDIEHDGIRAPARTGAVIRHGDTLLVAAPTEHAVILLPDGTELRTEDATTIVFRVVDGARHLHIPQGIIEADVRPQPAGKPLVITSSIARATVVGTRLRFAVSDAMTRLDVHYGAVEFANQNEDRLMVETGQYAIARPGQKKLQTPERMIQPAPEVIAAFANWQSEGKVIAADPDLVVWYDFQDDSRPGILPPRAGRSATDENGYPLNRDGRIYGAAWSDGRFPGLKKSLLFQKNAFVESCRDHNLYSPGPFSVVVWCRLLAFTEPVNCPVAIGYRGWGFQRRPNRSDLELFFYVDQRYQNVNGNTPLDDGKWHCLIGTYDGAMLRLFIDGQPDGERSVSGKRTPALDPLLIGANMDMTGTLNRFYQGWIDEVMVFKRALRPDEIVRIYDVGKPVEQPQAP